MEVREAVALGRARAQASAEARTCEEGLRCDSPEVLLIAKIWRNFELTAAISV